MSHCAQQSVFQRCHSEKNIYKSFIHKMAAKASWHCNYVTVTLCIVDFGRPRLTTIRS